MAKFCYIYDHLSSIMQKMKKGISLIPVLIFGVSCDASKYIDYENISSTVLENDAQLEELRRMIVKDVPDTHCRTIGKTHVLGWGYFPSGEWRKREKSLDNVQDVLNLVGISEERYKRYLEILDNVNAIDGVSHCENTFVGNADNDKRLTQTSIMLVSKTTDLRFFKYGNTCTASIVSAENNSPPPNEAGENGVSYIATPINDAWYVETRCY